MSDNIVAEGSSGRLLAFRHNNASAYKWRVVMTVITSLLFKVMAPLEDSRNCESQFFASMVEQDEARSRWLSCMADILKMVDSRK